MAKFTRFMKQIVIEGDEIMTITMEVVPKAPNTEIGEDFVLLQEKLEAEGQLGLLNQNIAGKI